MLESDLERQVVKWAESQGGYAFKLKEDAKRGWPDRSILLPDSRIAFVELKRPRRNRRSDMQGRRVDLLQCLGFKAAFCESLTEVQELFK